MGHEKKKYDPYIGKRRQKKLCGDLNAGFPKETMKKNRLRAIGCFLKN